MRPIVTDAAWSRCVLSVCLLDITISCAKTAEPIEMPSEVWTWVDLRVGARIPLVKGAI